MEIEFDTADDATNIAKHGLSLRDFKGFDSEPLVLVVPDNSADDNPKWTEKEFARARPASEVLSPDVVAALVKPRGRSVE